MKKNSVAGKKKIVRVYIACPYTKGDVIVNVRNSIVAAEKLRMLGFCPYNPLFTMLWHMIFPHADIQFWYGYDLEWLEVCDAVFRLPGESSGADKEVERAKELGMPVYTSYAQLPEVKDGND